MTDNDGSTKSLPERRKSGQWQKGRSGNPKGRGKGNLSKTTRFLQVMTSKTQQRALGVLQKVIRQAEAGDVDSQKMVMSMLQPFIKREAEREPGGKTDKRPIVNIVVSPAEGRVPTVAPRIIDPS